ncbi:MAG: radical SAM protein [Synergistaceae bacterium]|nr:radical SAM protein [Synergistaceae bacterium]
MPELHHFFECLLPVSLCNLECEYCYIIQEHRRAMKQIEFNYDTEHMLKALRKERLGGICYFSFCGTGETLMQKDFIPLVHGLLHDGHYVNITNNGTMTAKILELMNTDMNDLSRLHFAFSLHYIELMKRGMLNLFAENVRRVHDAGCSFLVQMNLYDGYIPYLDEIKTFCRENFGALPQVAATRLEHPGNMRFHTEGSADDYIAMGREFNSPLFEFTVRNFNVKRHEFCYAGAWSSRLIVKTGELNPCYAGGKSFNIFADPDEPVKYFPVGRCRSSFCFNSSHFLSLGVIPGFNAPSYAALRDRPEAQWYTPVMREFLSQKLCENNTQYTQAMKLLILTEDFMQTSYRKARRIISRIMRKLHLRKDIDKDERKLYNQQQPNVYTKEIHRVLSSGRNMQPEMQLLLHHPEKKMERKAA